MSPIDQALLGEFAFQAAAFLHELRDARGDVVGLDLERGGGFAEPRVAAGQVTPRGLARQRLDAADARCDGAFAYDGEQADFAERGDVRAAA